jgi:hypothetical protein
MVAVGFHMKALTSGEYEPRPGCDNLHINHLELIGIIVNVVLALAWTTTVVAPAGGSRLQDMCLQYLHPILDEEHGARH